MIDFAHNEGCIIYDEMSDADLQFWFDFRQKKNLRNYDNIYYTAKLDVDFTSDSENINVLNFRIEFDKYKKELNDNREIESILYYVPEMGNLQVVLRTFEFYNNWLTMPECFDIIFATSVPRSSSGKVVTPEILVQIRATWLWQYGAAYCIEESYKWLKAILKQYHFHCIQLLENRIDYCWHTNYYLKPSNLLNHEYIYKHKVSRWNEDFCHAHGVGSEDYDVDYILFGKKQNGLVLRMYNKTKEVLQLGYKAWFFDVWFFNGLINRYDRDCYCEAYKQLTRESRYSYLYIARLKWYLEHGTNEQYIKDCQFAVDQYDQYHLVDDDVIKLANKCTPRLNTIINIEYACGRKFLKTFNIEHNGLIPKNHYDNINKYGEACRLYDLLDNTYGICEYLVDRSFKLVDGKDSNKSRRDPIPFWASLKNTKLVDFKKTPEGVFLKREHTRKLDKQKVINQAVNKIISVGLYEKGVNEDDFSQDFIDTMGLFINDNTVAYANKCKKRKLQNLNPEFSKLKKKAAKDNIAIVNKEDGSIYDRNNIQYMFDDDRFYSDNVAFENE